MFFGPKFLFYMYSALNSQDELGIQNMFTAVSFLDLFTLTYFLMIFYPRKEWPEYFQFNIEAMRVRGPRRNN